MATMTLVRTRYNYIDTWSACGVLDRLFAAQKQHQSDTKLMLARLVSVSSTHPRSSTQGLTREIKEWFVCVPQGVSERATNQNSHVFHRFIKNQRSLFVFCGSEKRFDPRGREPDRNGIRRTNVRDSRIERSIFLFFFGHPTFSFFLRGPDFRPRIARAQSKSKEKTRRTIDAGILAYSICIV